jgi:O-antigen/teichoic acid export membrane protein
VTESQRPSTEPEFRTSVEAGGRIAIYTSIDQILSSLSNALLLFAVAQTVSLAQFGVFAMLVAVVFIWVGFNRGALGAPILLASNLQPRLVRVEAGYAMTWAALSGLIAAVILCVAGAIAGQFTIAVAFATTVPAVLVQDVLRYAAISYRQPLIAVFSDGLWTILILSAYLANVLGAAISAKTVVAIWGLSGLAAAAALSLMTGIRPRLYRILYWWKTYARARIRFGVVDALVPVYTAIVLFTVTMIVGSAVAGSLRGASTLLSPIFPLLSALPLVFLPHARRSVKSARRQWQLLMKTSWITSLLVLPVIAALVTIPPDLGRTVMGSTWDAAVAVVPYEGLTLAANCWMVSVNALLQTQGRSQAAFWIRLFQLAAQLSACTIAAFTIGTAVAIAASSALATWFTVVIGVILTKRVVRQSDKLYEV